jgi:hypothetical protein
LKDVAAEIRLLNDSFEADILDTVNNIENLPISKRDSVAKLIRTIIENYFLRSGEEFAVSLTQDIDPRINVDELQSVIIGLSPSERLIEGDDNVNLLLKVVRNFLATTNEASKEYLRLLSDSYTLFAFLEQVPDVQKVTRKLFNFGSVWLDTSVLLPLFSEKAFPEAFRPFTSMFKQTRAVNTRLYVTYGIIEEIERHLNLCETYVRSSDWKGRIPYVFAGYTIAGKSANAFASWVEQFRGKERPLDDIAEFLLDEFKIEVTEPINPAEIDDDIISAIRAYWQDVQHRRREPEGTFNMNVARLANHDAENCISVLSERRKQTGKSPLGYGSWLFTLDSAAWRMITNLDKSIATKIKHSPVMSIDFSLKYCAFEPNRERLSETPRKYQYIFSNQILESLLKELASIAQKVREESKGLTERIIQRRIRDALDREKLKEGDIQVGGLEVADSTIAGMF